MCFLLLLLTHTINMKLVEVFEVLVIYGHILYLETCPYKFLHGSPPSIVIVKEGTDMGQVSVVQIADSPCHIAHGVHYKVLLSGKPFSDIKVKG